eukprot:4089869-Prymnesium_polylepis.1
MMTTSGTGEARTRGLGARATGAEREAHVLERAQSAVWGSVRCSRVYVARVYVARVYVARARAARAAGASRATRTSCSGGGRRAR